MKKWKKFFRRFWDAFWRPEMLILPGQISFFLFLSVVPTITLIGYVCSYLNLSNDFVSTVLSNGIGSNFSEMLTPIITDTKISPTFFITLGVGYFIAANGMSSIVVASNTIYGIKDSGFFKRRLKSLIMELVIVVLLLFIILVPLMGSSIVNLLHYFNLSASTTATIVKIFSILKIPFSFIIIFIFIKTIYTMAPDKKIPSRNVNGGAIFTTIGWIATTSVYSYYIERYANYSIFYGSLANIVILMLWVYLLSYILVVGMAMNFHEELEKTGIIEVKKAIEESANIAAVYPDNNQSNKKDSESIQEPMVKVETEPIEKEPKVKVEAESIEKESTVKAETKPVVKEKKNKKNKKESK